ncbi:MAG: Transmembrane protein EpsG [Firmicutes bacterium ADurb.Bin193]|nr:MAG: Transmembrane protein EpsG [Firmicutes bacterium ADurb.Bin193]
MNAYIVYLSAIVVGAILFYISFSKDKLSYRFRAVYIFYCGVATFLLSALRHFSIGSDTFTYVDSFLLYEYRSFSDVLAIKFDKGYYALVKLISMVSSNYTVFLSVFAFIFTVSICVYIYRYSKEPFLSIIMLLSLGYLYFSMTGLRQTAAMSILLFSYKFVRERKLIRFLLLILLAYQFHNTSIVFLIAYPLAYLKVNWKHVTGVVAALIVAFMYKSYVDYFLFEVLNWERISHYKNYTDTITLSGFIIQAFIVAFCLVYYKNVTKEEPKDISLFNMVFLGLVFQAFTPIVSQFFRVSMYFSIANIALVPNAIVSGKNNNLKTIIYSTVMILLVAYYLFFSMDSPFFYPYRFFWSE